MKWNWLILGLVPRQSTWNKDDCKNFQDLTVGKSFKANIKHFSNDTGNGEKYAAELMLISTFSQLNVSEQLVQARRAQYI